MFDYTDVAAEDVSILNTDAHGAFVTIGEVQVAVNFDSLNPSCISQVLRKLNLGQVVQATFSAGVSSVAVGLNPDQEIDWNRQVSVMTQAIESMDATMLNARFDNLLHG